MTIDGLMISFVHHYITNDTTCYRCSIWSAAYLRMSNDMSSLVFAILLANVNVLRYVC